MRLGIDASNIRDGGGVIHLRELLGAARPDDHGISNVIVWGGSTTLKKLCPKPWLTLAHEPLLDQPLPLRFYWQISKLSELARKACDILFTPGGLYVGTFRPFVTMSQNMLPFERRERNRYGVDWESVRMRLLRFVQANSFRKADGLIFLTRYACSIIVRQIKRARGQVVIIPHGVGERFFEAPRKQRPLKVFSQERPLLVLYVSSISLYKHQNNVAQAVARLRQEGWPVELLLVGPAPHPPAMKSFLSTWRRLDPEERFIHYRGEIPYQELQEIYHQADMFVFASSCETISIILLEAMASGLPIACSNRGPMPEVYGEEGVYFDPERVDDIAAALNRMILSPELRADCAKMAYERAQNYSWERCAAETLSFLAKIGRDYTP